MTVFDLGWSPATLRVRYQLGRPQHSLTPHVVREWYACEAASPNCVAWIAESKIGLKAEIDEWATREDAVGHWLIEWALPAKGGGFVSLSTIDLHDHRCDVLLAQPFARAALAWFESLALAARCRLRSHPLGPGWRFVI